MNLKSTSPNSLTEAVRRKWRTPEQCITGEGEALFQHSSLLREETRVLGDTENLLWEVVFYETRKTAECLLPSNLGRSTPKILEVGLSERRRTTADEDRREAES